jgi:Novel toxin 16
MLGASKLDTTGNRLTWDIPPSSDPVEFADTMESVRASQNSGARVRLAQAAPVAPGVGPFTIVPGIMPGSFGNGEWTRHTINGHVGLFRWIGSLFHSSSPAPSDTAPKSADELNRVTAPPVDDAREQQLAKARNELSTGQSLTPPGFCHEEEHSRLTAAVERACKSGNIQACSPLELEPVLRTKALAFRACAIARARREDQCYKGGDLGHRTQIQQMWQGLNRCQTFLGMMQ